MKTAIPLIFLTIACLEASAFLQTSHAHLPIYKSTCSKKLHSTTEDNKTENTQFKSKRKEKEVSKFLTDFRTAKGNLVDPYKILKLPRTASSVEIKQSYKKLSRKLHPDAVARNEILPGKCANLEEVREEWEKVKLSYEILIDRKTRLKYDRNSVVADPGAALTEAVGGAVGNVVGGLFSWGIEGVFKFVAGGKDAGDQVSDSS